MGLWDHGAKVWILMLHGRMSLMVVIYYLEIRRLKELIQTKISIKIRQKKISTPYVFFIYVLHYFAEVYRLKEEFIISTYFEI